MLAPDTFVHDRYKVVGIIGRGGMGAVYEAIDTRLKTRVALKQLLPAGKDVERAFQREAQLLAGLRHPALPRVIDYFVEEHGRYLVMDFIPGDDLAARLERRGRPFPVEEAFGLADQILDVLEFLHAQEPPILHRDLKPHNVKVTSGGRVVLLDFGLAKGTPSLGTQTSDASSLHGYSPHYAPLEQLQGTGTTPRSDLYALGATLYHLVTGMPPVRALDRSAAIVNGRPDPLAPPHERRPEVPRAASAVIVRAMALPEAGRYASAAEMRRAVRAAVARSGSVRASVPTDAATTVAVAGEAASGSAERGRVAERLGVEGDDGSGAAPGPAEQERREGGAAGPAWADGSARPPVPGTGSGPVLLPRPGGAPAATAGPGSPGEGSGPRKAPGPEAGIEPHAGGSAAPGGARVGPTRPTAAGAAPGVQAAVGVRRRSWRLAAAGAIGAGAVGLVLVVAGIVGRAPVRVGGARAGESGEPAALAFAGAIAAPGRADAHGFEGAGGERVFVEFVRHDGSLTGVPVHLIDPDGREVAAGCFGCGHMGLQVLPRAGSYRIVAGDERSGATGRYAIRLHRVPVPASLSIALDQRIAPDRPGAGAGVLRVPGEHDVYTFDAPAGARIFVETLKHDPPLAQVGVALVDPDGRTIASRCLGCGSLGFQVLGRAGLHEIVVGSERDAGTGAYELRLYSVPAPTVTAIALSPDGRVTRVAGRIGVPGEEHAYEFEAASRGEIFVQSASYDTPAAQASVALVDPDGRELVRHCLGCGDIGLQSVAGPGAYRIVVFDRSGATGAYEVHLNAVPAPVEYEVRLGGRIAPDTPGPGAGLVGVAGERDVYVFRGSRGQRLRIEGRPRDSGLGYLAVEVLGADGELVAQGLADSGLDAVLPASGLCRVVVRAGRSGGTGAYDLRIERASR
jgi:hypothetical protein